MHRLWQKMHVALALSDAILTRRKEQTRATFPTNGSLYRFCQLFSSIFQSQCYTLQVRRTTFARKHMRPLTLFVTCFACVFHMFSARTTHCIELNIAENGTCTNAPLGSVEPFTRSSFLLQSVVSKRVLLAFPDVICSVSNQSDISICFQKNLHRFWHR